MLLSFDRFASSWSWNRNLTWFFFFSVDCGWLLGCPTQLYKGSCFGVNLSHPNFSHIPKQQTYSNEVWKGYQLSRCWWVFEIWNLGQGKKSVVLILFLYQPIKVLDRISKKTVICWMIHRGASHMIVQAIAAKLQWFISQELQSSRWVTLGAFGTLPPRNNDLAMYIGFIFKKNSDTLPKTNISSIPLIIFGW